MKNKRITFLYVLIVFITVIFTWTFHEFGHWITYELMGFDAQMSFNKAGVRGSDIPNMDQQILGAAAGPIFTLVQAIVAYGILIKKGWNKYIYLLLFTPFYMRFLAGVMNFLNPNDEGFISHHFGLGTFTLSIIVSGFLFWLVLKVSKKNQLTAKFHILTTLFVLVFSSLLILTDQFLRLRLL